MVKKRPIIIDCDTGTDDAIGIIAALYAPEFDVRAFTTVTGNVELAHTSRNTLNLVRALGFNTKVAVGAATPIFGDINRSGDGTHGDTGLGDLVLPQSSDSFYEKTAIETIYEEAVLQKGELELIPIGPLTNIALAIKAHPDLKGLIKQIVFMGGAMYGGNMTTTAEFNIWCDPEAASIVLQSGIPITMVGFDVTSVAALTDDDAAFMHSLHTTAGDIVGQILDFMITRRDAGGEDLLMHDALAVGVAINPNFVKLTKYFVDCECKGTYTRGHTFVAVTRFHRKDANCYVSTDLKLDDFRAWIRETIGRSAQ